MLKNLSQHLEHADELMPRREKILEQLAAVRAQKNKLFDEAAPDDERAIERLGVLGSQETLLLIQIERVERELEGTRATCANAANETRQKVVKKLVAASAAQFKRLDSTLSPFYQSDRERGRATELLMQRAVPPHVFALRKHAGGLQGFSWHPAQLDGIAYARQILSMSTRALLALDNGK